MKVKNLLPGLGVLEILAILVLHFVLIRWLAEKNLVATMLAAGKHIPRLTLATAGFFLLVRLFAVLFLPGMILSRLGMLLFDRRTTRPDGQAPAPPDGPHSPSVALIAAAVILMPLETSMTLAAPLAVPIQVAAPAGPAPAEAPAEASVPFAVGLLRNADGLVVVTPDGKPILPPNDDPDPKKRFQRSKYWPVIPHPYLAFFSPEDKCLEAPQGLAKTQTIILDVWAGAKDAAHFEKKFWQRSLEPVRATVSPSHVAATLALGRIWPVDKPRFPEAETTFEEAFNWHDRHIRVMECYAKFDYGDFKYFTASTNYLTEVGKWATMQEMPREGYWHNNERDTARGLLLHYLRTGNPRAFELASITARHMLDVDIRHHPHWGMYTHSYGHCYLAAGGGGASDHSWLLGLLEWAGVSGDPLVWDWMLKCGEFLRGLKTDWAHRDTRTTSMQLHMMVTFHRYTGDPRYLEAAKAPAEALLATQRQDGSWSKYLAKPADAAGFVDHAILAVADYYDLTKDSRFLLVLTKSLASYLPTDADEMNGMTSDVPLLMLGRDVAYRATKDEKFVRWAKKVYAALDQGQNRSPCPIGRGDFWATWGVNEPQKSADLGAPLNSLTKPAPSAPPPSSPTARWPCAPSPKPQAGRCRTSRLA